MKDTKGKLILFKNNRSIFKTTYQTISVSLLLIYLQVFFVLEVKQLCLLVQINI